MRKKLGCETEFFVCIGWCGLARYRVCGATTMGLRLEGFSCSQCQILHCVQNAKRGSEEVRWELKGRDDVGIVPYGGVMMRLSLEAAVGGEGA